MNTLLEWRTALRLVAEVALIGACLYAGLMTFAFYVLLIEGRLPL